jgi:hypothetical protein
VAIFHPDIIANVASINHKNIVPLSHISIFSLISKNQKGMRIHMSIVDTDMTKIAF